MEPENGWVGGRYPIPADTSASVKSSEGAAGTSRGRRAKDSSLGKRRREALPGVVQEVVVKITDMSRFVSKELCSI